jgi:hypothetical protein
MRKSKPSSMGGQPQWVESKANYEANGSHVQAETYLNALTTQAIMDMFVVSLSD